jgi:hypothetical protein
VTGFLDLLDWRRRMSEVYAAVRAEPDPQAGHALWRARRDELFRTHPQSPLPPGDPLRETGLPYWPYRDLVREWLQLGPVISHLPKGYGSMLADNGLNLAGGQRQLIGLARAFFGSPRVVSSRQSGPGRGEHDQLRRRPVRWTRPVCDLGRGAAVAWSST